MILNWRALSSKDYNELSDSEKSFKKLFYILDEKKIYQGKEDFSSHTILVGELPTVGYYNKSIYVKSNSLEGYVWSGRWEKCINNAIYFVNKTIQNNLVSFVSYDEITNGIEVRLTDGSTDIVTQNNMLIILSKNKDMSISISESQCKLSNLNLNLNISDFIDSIEILENLITINFTGGGTPIKIDKFIVCRDNEFVISGNQFINDIVLNFSEQLKVPQNINVDIIGEGLYFKTIDTTNKELGIMDTILDSVKNIKLVLQNTLDNKMQKVESGRSDEILVASDDGGAILSGVTISNVVSEIPSDYSILTEKALKEFADTNIITKDNITKSTELPNDYETASDTRVISEKGALSAININIIK